MRKLKLEIDELRVESFETAVTREASGTVRGQMPFKLPASDESNCGDVCGSGSGGESGYATCPCTQKYSCPDGCTEFCTAVTACATYAGGCC